MSSVGLGLTDALGPDVSQEELDFSDLFLYHPPGEDFHISCDKDDPGPVLQSDTESPLVVVDHHAAYLSASDKAAASQDPSSFSPTTEHLSGAPLDTLGLTSRPGTIPAPSPRIEITPSGDSLSSQTHDRSPGSKAYRECVSPASSNSSTGWTGVEAYSPLASPSVSPSNAAGCGASLSALDLCPGLQAIHTSSTHSSPGTSPQNGITDDTFLHAHPRVASPRPHQRSRSASPTGKRTYDQVYSCQGATPVKQRSRSPSPIPSPHEQQGSYYPHQYQVHAEFHPQAQASTPVPKEVLNSLGSGQILSAVVHGPHRQVQRPDCVYGDEYNWALEPERTARPGPEVKSEAFYMVPAAWPRPHPAFGLPMTPLPSLEWPLPCQSGQYQLLIQHQPRPHHRAHYETEGSRGAVKTPNGGHPEVQLHGYQGPSPLGLQVFIGTADERLLKPHAFYQVHRITGKTVTTPSMEKMINGTKVLEIFLEPKNHMGVVIDCVGILKLRNADIELRNGETDIGRKNTRVRLVFRVHIPQPGGQLVSLQVASHPIECSQRSAQEVPAVERQDLDKCSVRGGQQMVLTGQNFTSDSKVVFSEKTQDGRQLWEVEATVDRDKTQANMLFVEVPPYQDQSIRHPAKVNFYVINGKKKRSQPQHFIYTPMIAIKAEPVDDYPLNSYGYSENHSASGLSMKALYHHLEQDNFHALNMSPSLFHASTVDPRLHGLTPDPLDIQSVYYQSRSTALIANQVLFNAPSSRYTNCGGPLLGGSTMTSHSPHASSPNQCSAARTAGGKLGERPHVAESLEAYSVARHQGPVQTVLPLGKSPPHRYVQGQVGSEPLTHTGSGRSHHEEPAAERTTVKQENFSYLEDVNDIIRRDLTGHDGD